jgi:hypothetical protein
MSAQDYDPEWHEKIQRNHARSLAVADPFFGIFGMTRVRPHSCPYCGSTDSTDDPNDPNEWSCCIRERVAEGMAIANQPDPSSYRGVNWGEVG